MAEFQMKNKLTSTRNIGGNVMMTLIAITIREMYAAASGNAPERMPVL
jgi:hypothetical protein